MACLIITFKLLNPPSFCSSCWKKLLLLLLLAFLNLAWAITSLTDDDAVGRTDFDVEAAVDEGDGDLEVRDVGFLGDKVLDEGDGDLEVRDVGFFGDWW